ENYKQFQYQKDVCHINKGKRLSYEVGTTGVQKKARSLKVKQDHQVVSNSRSRSSTKKLLRNLETSNENIQEFVANKVATGSNSVYLDMLSDMREHFKIIEQLIAQRS
ncbi:7888_t:CDS:2, partial [Gigaspora margarita]